jgi:hypothetical protein
MTSAETESVDETRKKRKTEHVWGWGEKSKAAFTLIPRRPHQLPLPPLSRQAWLPSVELARGE